MQKTCEIMLRQSCFVNITTLDRSKNVNTVQLSHFDITSTETLFSRRFALC